MGHRNEIFVPLNGFWPLRGGRASALSRQFSAFRTKIAQRENYDIMKITPHLPFTNMINISAYLLYSFK